MQRAALYIRVSTNDQLEFSPDAQKRALLEYAKRNKMTVDPIHIYLDEGISGTNAKKRPAFQTMIATAKKKPNPFDAILVHKFDRFARSREDSVVYKSLLKRECNVSVISITEQLEDDKFSVILEAMLEAMAEYYSLNLAEEVTKGMTEKATRGGFQASRMLGYNAKDLGGKLEIIEDEANIIRIIFNKFVNEEMTYHAINDYINKSGYRTQNGNKFERRSIKYILENPIYAGYVRWNRRNKYQQLNPREEWIIEKGLHDPIVSKEIFDKAQIRIEQIKKLYGSNPRPTTSYGHWLSGTMRCSACDSTLTFSGPGKNRKRGKGYYCCNRYRKGSCSTSNHISVIKLEKYILDNIDNDIDNFEEVPEEVVVHTHTETIEIDTLQSQLDKTMRKYDIARNAYLNEIDTMEEYKANKTRIQQEEKDIRAQMKKLSRKTTGSSNNAKKLIKNMIEGSEILKDENATIEQKNNALRSFVKCITIDKENDIIDIEYYLNV